MEEKKRFETLLAIVQTVTRMKWCDTKVARGGDMQECSHVRMNHVLEGRSFTYIRDDMAIVCAVYVVWRLRTKVQWRAGAEDMEARL